HQLPLPPREAGERLAQPPSGLAAFQVQAGVTRANPLRSAGGVAAEPPPEPLDPQPAASSLLLGGPPNDAEQPGPEAGPAREPGPPVEDPLVGGVERVLGLLAPAPRARALRIAPGPFHPCPRDAARRTLRAPPT